MNLGFVEAYVLGLLIMIPLAPLLYLVLDLLDRLWRFWLSNVGWDKNDEKKKE